MIKGMKPQTNIERAQAYVKASNEHDVELIATLLSDAAVYRSTGVGGHDGKAAILAMNAKFFAEYPDVHWDAVNYRTIAGEGVEFDFAISLKGKLSSGVERVFFDAQGLILLVVVER